MACPIHTSHTRQHARDLRMCTLAGAGLVGGRGVPVQPAVDVVGGERALQGTGLLRVDLLRMRPSAGPIAAAGAAAGLRGAVRQDRALSRGAGRAGGALTWNGHKREERVRVNRSVNHTFLRFPEPFSAFHTTLASRAHTHTYTHTFPLRGGV